MSELTVFAFNTAAVRSLTLDGEPWFVAADIANILGFKHVPHMLRMLDEGEKWIHILDTLGGPQESSIVNESGMYACVLKSRRPEAKAFRKWMTSEVLPALRRQGYYAVQNAAPGPFVTGNTIHAADLAVAADRTFRSYLRAGRSAGLPHARALRRANDITRARTGIDMLAELEVAEEEPVISDRGRRDPFGVHAFCDAWRRGELPLPVVVCRSTDWYGAYARWRSAAGERAASINRAIPLLAGRRDLRKLRSRWFDAAGSAQILTFILPEDECAPPAGLSQTDWLTDRARQFAQALERWKSSSA